MTRLLVRYIFWTSSPKVSGFLKKPKDFIVREIPKPGLIKRYDRAFRKITGRQCLFLLEKRNRTTMEAVDEIAKQLGIPRNRIGYAGSKDKKAVTYQYMTIHDVKPEQIKKLRIRGLKFHEPRLFNKKLHLGDLVGNEFKITLHNVKNAEHVQKFLKEVKEKGVPNYFGPQRFSEKNHVIGYYLVKGDFDKVCNLLFLKHVKILYRFPKRLLKLFVHALQSWIFNETLSECIKKNIRGIKTKSIPLVGYKTVLGKSKVDAIVKNVLKKIKIKPQDFRIQEFKHASCPGSARDMFINLAEVKYRLSGNKLTIEFMLPKGSYATIVLQEMCKTRFEHIQRF